MMRGIVRIAVSALKRFDTLVAAVAVGFTVEAAMRAWFCAESSCRSTVETAVLYVTELLAVIAAGVLLWRLTRRWWSRTLAVVAMLYLSNAVPVWVWRHGRWMVPLDAGRSCLVRAGASRAVVRDACGAPAYWCEGPKLIQSDDLWNPLALRICGFEADVYGSRYVTYGCTGAVAYVTGFDAEPPERARPVHCVTWGSADRTR